MSGPGEIRRREGRRGGVGPGNQSGPVSVEEGVNRHIMSVCSQ